MKRCWACRISAAVGFPRSPDSCDGCRRTEVLERLLRTASEPGEDLWPAVRARLAQRAGRRARGRSFAVLWSAAAAAGLVGILLGALVAGSRPPSIGGALREAAASGGGSASRDGPDLVVEAARITGSPARLTLMTLERGETLVFLQPERDAQGEVR